MTIYSFSLFFFVQDFQVLFLWYDININLKICKLSNVTTNFLHHIETSQLISNANQLTGFHMIGNIGH